MLNKRKFNDPTKKSITRDDMEFLHMAYSKEVFEAGGFLFLQKWIDKEKEFAENFEETYLRRR